MRVWSLSNMPSCGVASRMLFISMFMNTASNCCAACFSASGEAVFASSLSWLTPWTSSANLEDRSAPPMLI